MYTIQTLNNISDIGLQRLPPELYRVTDDAVEADAIMLRSFKMHDMEIAGSVLAVGRAGAGVNNIPIAKMSKRGVPVFNAPGANANAVKELVVGSMLLAARNLCSAWDYVRELDLQGGELDKAVEAGKKQFVGFELPSRTLGVVGLGAIGVQVANTALSLGMRVVGFDPQITVRRAWELSSGVQQARSLDDLVRRADIISVHVPLVDATRNLISAAQVQAMPKGAVLINLSRGGIVEEEAVLAALDAGGLQNYVTDFPTRDGIDHAGVIALPHLGASTHEAEENCAVMVADNLRQYLEHGVIRHSVNFPEADMPRADAWRITVANANVPNMVGQMSTVLAEAGLNIADMLNKSRGDVAYTIVDLDGAVPADTLNALTQIKGVLKVRDLGRAEA